MNFIKNILNFFQRQIIRIGLAAVTISLIIYLAYPNFRVWLLDNKIDPNFLIGFFTIIALLLSLIQVSKDRKYNYNLLIIESQKEKGFLIIAKLISIKNKGHIYLGTLEIIAKVLGTGRVYRDTNDVLSKTDLEKDMEMVATYIDTLFPEAKEDWNILIDKISAMGTLSTNTVINYNENYHLIGTGGFTNDALDNIDLNFESVKLINEEVDQLTLKIRDLIVEKINSSTGEFRKTFEFRF
jgi:hypothetical protein